MISIESVKAELEDPDIAAWAKTNSNFFEPEDLSSMGDVSQWVFNQVRFKREVKERFLAKADTRLIAFALAHGHTVVTMEVSAPDSKASVKIPDVCKALGVDCQNTFDVLKILKAKFILEVNP